MLLVHRGELHEHERRLDGQEQSYKRLEDKIEGLRNWIMASLLTGLVAALGIMAQLILGHHGAKP